MHRILLPAFLLVCGIFFGGLHTIAATLYTYTNGGSSGLWNAPGTWTTDPSGLSLTGSAVPGNNDVVTILNGFTVNLSANVATTGLTININNGGTLDLSTFTFVPINNLSGSGILKIGAGYFPTVTSNNFISGFASGATVEYYNFTGTLPVSINYPNLIFSNSTGSNHIITFSNASAYSFIVFGNFTTLTTGLGTLSVLIGTQATNIINATINGNVTLGSGTTLGVGAFNAIHTLTLLGNVTNNGIIDFSNGTQYITSTTGAANVTFSGATDNTLACNGITDFYFLTVNKGLSSTNILSVTSTNTANLNFYGGSSTTPLFRVTNGTLRLGANIIIPRIYGTGSGNYDLGSPTNNPMLWVDGAIVNANTSAFVVYGKFRITAGSFTAIASQGSVIREEGQYIIEGGTFTTEKFRPSTTDPNHRGSFTMSGGTFNASGTGSDDRYARFSLPFPEQVFIMSGGTINVSNPQSGGNANNGGIHIGCAPSNYNVTGGTINAILSGGAASFSIASTAPFWNLNVTRTGGTPTTVRLFGIGSVGGTEQLIQPLTVLNNFTIDGTNSPVFNANGQNVTLGRDFTINAGATYTPSANTTIFNGTADQNLINNGTITSGFYNLTVNKTGGAVILGGTATTYSVTQTLTLTSGILNDGGKTILASGNIYNEAVHTGTGSITLNGAATQTLTGDGNGTYGNLILNNPSIPGALATSNLNVSGTLTLAGAGNSLFSIGQYLLNLTSISPTALITSGSGFSSSKMILTSGFQSDRGIQKNVGDLSAFVFPFGVGSIYTPATVQLTSAPTTYGTITSRPVNARHPLVVAGNTNNVTWYWKTVSAGFSGLGATAVTHSYQYTDASVVPGGDDVNYIPARYNPTSWIVISDLNQVNEATNIISFSGVGYIDGEFTAGVPAAFGTVKVFYSKRNGNWTNIAPGTTPWSNVSHSGPDAITAPVVGDHVYIGDGNTFNHTITVTANNQASGGLAINSGSVLDVGIYTGHNFGTFDNTQITGSGILRISSSTATAAFPAGDFGNFIRSEGGTVEYYTTAAQDFSIPSSSSAPTNLPLISYRNLILTPGSGRFIRMPNQDMGIYSDMNVQGATSTGVASLNAGAATTLAINGNLTVASGNLQFQNGTAQNLEIDGNVTVGTGALFDLASSGTVTTNQLSINGNLVNNGVFDMANSTRICNVTFTGSTNATVTGTGATTDFNILTISKGTSPNSILNVNATAFTLSGSTLPLVLANGTFRLTSAQTVTIANGADFSVPSTTRLSANGGTLQLTGGNGIDLLLSGTLEVLNGTINVGTTANDNSIEYAATGQPTITSSGGSLNIRSQVRRSSFSTQGGLIYNQSGTGTVTVGISSASTVSRGVFEILNPTSTFTMTGGTLQIARALLSGTISELYLQPSSSTVTGGTIEIGTGATSQLVNINSTIPVYSVNVTGTSNTARLVFNGLTIRGSLDIANTDVFNANSLNVTINGNFTNSDVIATTGVAVGGYQAGNISQTTTISSSAGNQIVTGTTGNLTNFGNLVINNTFPSGTVTLATNSNLRVNGSLTLSNGVFAGADNTVTVVGSVSNSTTQTNTNPTTGSITLAGGSNQLITGNGSGRFGNLILNNGSGATFGANQQITGTLTFTNGILTIGSYLLNISNTSLTAISGASPARYIVTSGNLSDAGITKAFAASVTNGNFVYPIGVSGKYTPANYTLSTGALGGTITIRPVNSKHPSATGFGTAFINHYWSVTNSVIILNALTHTYTYAAADEAGVVADYRDARFKGGAWTIGIVAGNPNTTTRVITFTNTDVQGDYTTGEATAFVNPTTYTSIASGNWESDLSVWDVDPPGLNLGPPQGSFVIISEGHTVTVTGNSKRMATLEIKGRLHLGNSNGHDFGTVTTSGAGLRTMQIQSSLFPSGDFSNFNSATGGTVEYDGAVTLPTQGTYNNLSFTSAGIKTLPNADLTINGNFTILNGTVTGAVNNRSIVMLNSFGDFTNNAVFNAGTGVIIVGRDLLNSGASAIFTAGNGTGGLRVGRNFVNSTSATFTMGSDSLGVRGTFNNSSTFTANAGAIRVTGNLNNTGGTFTGGSGFVSVIGSMTNNSSYSAGSGPTTVRGSFLNSGASAVYSANINVLTVGGNVTHAAGSTFNGNSGSVLAGGNWTNTSTFIAGTGSVVFESASAQTLTGVTSFNNMTRTNGGALTLNNEITVGGILTLTSGNIITGSNSVSLTNTALQPASGYSSSSFIDGRLSISFPNAAGTGRVYPIGKGTIYRPVTIQQTAASTSAVVRVEMIQTPPSGIYPVTVSGLSTTRYYAIDQLSGTMNSPTIELNFNTNAPLDENITTPGNLRILKASVPTGPWTDEGGSGVFSPASPSGYATSGVTSIANTTFFTLSGDAPLPITLKSFAAILRDHVVELRWETYSEKNNAFFTVERSGPELQFDSISFIDGAGNSSTLRRYYDVDPNPLSDISYYRLKQTDYDLKFTYSNVVRIDNSNNGNGELSLYPSPSTISEPIFLKLKKADKNSYVVITDITGRIFFEGKADLSSIIDIHTLKLRSNLQRGVYIISVASGNFKDVKKIIIQ